MVVEYMIHVDYISHIIDGIWRGEARRMPKNADRAMGRATYFRPRASKSLYLSTEMVGMVATRFDAELMCQAKTKVVVCRSRCL